MTIASKSVLIFGGTSGIGYAAAEASLKSQAASVTVISSNLQRVEATVQRLRSGKFGDGSIKGFAVNVKDEGALKKLLQDIGEVDHIIWSSGDSLPLNWMDMNLEAMKDSFDVRFWGAVIVAHNAKFRPGGSFTLTTGTVIRKPAKGWAIGAAIMGAVDSFTRGLAVDLAPIRVNSVCPGLVKTEMWERIPDEQRDTFFSTAAEKLLVKHVAEPNEIAEAYVFLMKCDYVTGQSIQVDGGAVLS